MIGCGVIYMKPLSENVMLNLKYRRDYSDEHKLFDYTHYIWHTIFNGVEVPPDNIMRDFYIILGRELERKVK